MRCINIFIKGFEQLFLIINRNNPKYFYQKLKSYWTYYKLTTQNKSKHLADKYHNIKMK
jgi:hypothetical protein